MNIVETWNRFWFKPSTGRPEAYFRFAYALFSLFDLAGSYSKFPLLFSNQGVHPITPYDFLFPPWAVNLIFGIWILALVFLLIGYRPRLFAILNFLCVFYFFGLRRYSAPHVADWMSHAMAFYLLFMKSDRCFSIRPDTSGSAAPVWPVRLAQINLAGIYWTAGVSKLSDSGWLEGWAFTETLANPFISRFDYSWLLPHSWLLVPLNYAVILFEIFAPFFLISKKTRPWAVLSLLIFHLGIDLTINVGWFVLYTSAYLLVFWDDISWFSKKTGAPSLIVSKKSSFWINSFLVFHLTAFLLAQMDYTSLELRRWNIKHIPASGLPVFSTYIHHAARIQNFHVWPTSYFLKPARFLYFEAQKPDGHRTALPPFSPEGTFAPGWSYYRAARDGLMFFRIVTIGLTENQWRFLSAYLVKSYRRSHGGDCPDSLDIFMIKSNLENFKGNPKHLDVDKHLLVKARPSCSDKSSEVEMSFTDIGRQLILPG